jgi:rubredoxin-NAD+ reductase
MSVVVKTPSAPIVVCPPPQGKDGIWQEEVSDSGARALFRAADGRLLGFALAGDVVREKAGWSAEVPDWL